MHFAHAVRHVLHPPQRPAPVAPGANTVATRVQQVLGPSGSGCGWPHRAGQNHHGFGGVQHFVQNHAVSSRVSVPWVMTTPSPPSHSDGGRTAMPACATPHHPCPCCRSAQLALQPRRACQNLQTGHGRQQLFHAHLRGGCSQCCPRLGRGAPSCHRCPEPQFLPTHLHTPKNW